VITFDEARGLDAAIECVVRGDFGAAYDAVEAEPDALRRAQAELYVRHHAGDLVGALASGERGLDVAPDDAWLLERCAFIALTLRRAPTAAEHALALDRVLRTAPEAERVRFGAAAESAKAEASALVATAEAKRGALTRARTLVGSVVLVALVLAWAAARR
jgi:hypothetical protein